MPNFCIVVVGPTASGKTSVSIQLALHFKSEIISADSRQCFKELNIGVAKPSAMQLQQVNHYFINSHSIQQEVNASVFEKYALKKIAKIYETRDLAIMVGGTGLYLNAFCDGIDEIPMSPKEIREEIESAYKSNGLQWLQDAVKSNDPEFFAVGEIRNPQRLIRALEVRRATGKSILSFRKGDKRKRDFIILKIGLDLPKEQLHQQIHNRVDEMVKGGLVDEVRSLLPYKNLNALQTVGYTEIFDHLEGKITLEKAIELVKQNTRQYAKRQLTWFRKDKEIKWFSPGQVEEIIQYIKDFHGSPKESLGKNTEPRI